ncbi:Fic family protein [Flavobacterium poyangense]|uniref:Fic family protein n=1 Tax=Flavobacterium poyangense TaxID=2204302 RepID=UPI00142249BB|nr:Fic family protein [Flavobacterium sp. JXAS1]
MKIESPPNITDFITTTLIDDYVKRKYETTLRSTDDRYFYWDELKYRKNLPFPDDLEKSWALIKLHRQGSYKKLKFGGKEFNYNVTENIQKNLHEFDLKLIGGLYKSPITQSDKLEYLKSSVLEEAIASSQVEGAATTTKVAIEMLKSDRKPRTESEQMIVNNFRAIKFITGELDKKLDFEFIVEIHKIMTANTGAEYCSGSFRKKTIYVQDHVDGEVAHVPPDASDVEQYMQDLCDFANSEKPFIHPIIKASIIHFMFGYIHPFLDGNGRTARALFYWFLLKKEYSLIKNISISRAILNSRIQYDKAFLKTENDENDLTYFINYSIKSLRVAFESLINYRDKKKTEAENSHLIAYKLLNKGLNRRQAELVSHLYSKENAFVNISSYSKKNGVVRQTARKDLNELIHIGLIGEEKLGRDIVVRILSKVAVDQFLNR